jgi:tRNA threonylcarbamoyladenosine biosynthesis protein TsaB
MIESLLSKAGLTLAELDAIAFGCGPGSFTGIRIAASLAQGLAFAHHLPVIPVSSLAAAAQAAYLEHGVTKLIVAVDARMGQIYFAAYQVENNIVFPVIAEQLLAPDAIPLVPGEGWVAIGDGWGVYESALLAGVGAQPLQIDANRVPTAEAVLSLAKEKFNKGDWVGAAEALPVYLR